MLERLIEFEEKSGIVNFTFDFNNEIMWPYFRYIIFRKVIDSDSKIDNQFEQAHPKSEKREKFFFRNFVKNPFLEKNKDIIFFYPDSKNNKNKDGSYFNRLYDYYAYIYDEETLMIEESTVNLRPYNRTFKNVKYQDFIDEIINIKYCICQKDYIYKDVETAKQFINCLKDKLPFKLEEGFYVGLEKKILEMSAKIKYVYSYYYQLLKRLNPKIIFMEGACYGTAPRICIIKIANKLGIKTAEFQHGFIGKNHIAYNYPNYFERHKELTEYFPKYFLMMGEYWGKEIRIPCEKIVIGNPHLYSKIDENVEEQNNTILIIPFPGYPKLYIDLVKNFVSTSFGKKYNIIFRLHPRERNNIKKYEDLKKFKNVQINIHGDVYDYIKRSKYVIGDFSTVLYEAVAFSKVVLIFENKYSIQNTSGNFGIWFKNSEELIKILKSDKEKLNSKYDSNYYWESNWKENYVNFIEKDVYHK